MINFSEISESQLGSAIKTILNRKSTVQEYEDAVAGIYDINQMCGSPQFKKYLMKSYYKYADNLCPLVISAVSDRLNVEGFEFYNPARTLEKQLKLVLKKMRFDSLQKQIHTTTLRDGSCYVVLSRDLNGVFAHPNTADVFEVVRDYDNPQKLIAGVKFWECDEKQRLTIYYSDRIERYYAPEAKVVYGNYISCGKLNMDIFEPYNLDGFDYIQYHGFNSLPVFAFINNPDTKHNGISELSSVLPIQKTINTALINLLTACEAWSLPTRYILGYEAEYDSEGRTKPLKMESGGVWVFGDKEIKIGQMDSADLEQQLKVINDFRIEIARISSIPMHLFGLSSDIPSGEALKVAERSLIGKVVDRQVQYGNVYEDMFSLILGVPTTNYIETIWSNPSPSTEQEMWQTNKLKIECGVPLQEVLKESGYSDDHIKSLGLNDPSTNI